MPRPETDSETFDLAALAAALGEARARPNPPVVLTGQDATARYMQARGATHRIDRYGWGGAWVGYDYLDADGRVITSTMAAFGR